MFKTDSFNYLEAFALRKVTPDFPVDPGCGPKLVLSFPTLLSTLSRCGVKAGPGLPGPPAGEIRSARIPSLPGTRPRCLVSQGSPSILFIRHFQPSDGRPGAVPRLPGLSRAAGCSSAAGMIHQLEPSLLRRVRDLKAV